MELTSGRLILRVRGGGGSGVSKKVLVVLAISARLHAPMQKPHLRAGSMSESVGTALLSRHTSSAQASSEEGGLTTCVGERTIAARRWPNSAGKKKPWATPTSKIAARRNTRGILG